MGPNRGHLESHRTAAKSPHGLRLSSVEFLPQFLRSKLNMPLAAGTRLGVFEILAPLGKGGMGEVYRARDTKLGRDVAVKILPGELAADSERLARFRREAHLLASLNHQSSPRSMAWRRPTANPSSFWSWWMARSFPSE